MITVWYHILDTKEFYEGKVNILETSTIRHVKLKCLSGAAILQDASQVEQYRLFCNNVEFENNQCTINELGTKFFQRTKMLNCYLLPRTKAAKPSSYIPIIDFEQKTKHTLLSHLAVIRRAKGAKTCLFLGPKGGGKSCTLLQLKKDDIVEHQHSNYGPILVPTTENQYVQVHHKFTTTKESLLIPLKDKLIALETRLTTKKIKSNEDIATACVLQHIITQSIGLSFCLVLPYSYLDEFGIQFDKWLRLLLSYDVEVWKKLILVVTKAPKHVNMALIEKKLTVMQQRLEGDFVMHNAVAMLLADKCNTIYLVQHPYSDGESLLKMMHQKTTVGDKPVNFQLSPCAKQRLCTSVQQASQFGYTCSTAIHYLSLLGCKLNNNVAQVQQKYYKVIKHVTYGDPLSAAKYKNPALQYEYLPIEKESVSKSRAQKLSLNQIPGLNTRTSITDSTRAYPFSTASNVMINSHLLLTEDVWYSYFTLKGQADESFVNVALYYLQRLLNNEQHNSIMILLPATTKFLFLPGGISKENSCLLQGNLSHSSSCKPNKIIAAFHWKEEQHYSFIVLDQSVDDNNIVKNRAEVYDSLLGTVDYSCFKSQQLDTWGPKMIIKEGLVLEFPANKRKPESIIQQCKNRRPTKLCQLIHQLDQCLGVIKSIENWHFVENTNFPQQAANNTSASHVIMGAIAIAASIPQTMCAELFIDVKRRSGIFVSKAARDPPIKRINEFLSTCIDITKLEHYQLQ